MNELLLHHQPLLQALGLAMLHSLGQGFILFLLLKILLPFIPGTKANARYLLSYAALVLLFVGFGYTFFNEWQAAKAVVDVQSTGYVLPAVATGNVAAVQAPQTWNFSLVHYLDTLRRYLPLAALGYAAGICLLCCRMIWQLFKVQSLRKLVIEPDEPMNRLFASLRQRVGWNAAITLKLSPKINVPVVFGHLKPLVLLPVALAARLDVQQLEAIILHEIGHVKRHDYLFNILQSVIETLLFFNPFTRWIATNIRLEREHCCDDFVLKHTRQSLPYAYVLLALEEYRSASLSPAMAADGNSKSPLFNRIKRITNMTTPQQKKQRNIGAVTILVLVAAMACFATAFSQDKKTKEPVAKTAKANTEQADKEDEDTYPVSPQHKGTRKEVAEEAELAEGISAKEAMQIAKQAMATAAQSMKEIDWNKVASDAEKASKDIDWDAVGQSLEQAKSSIDAVDWKEVRQSIKEAQSSIDWSEMRKAMEEASREVDKAMKELEQELKKEDKGHSFNSRMSSMDEETAQQLTRRQQKAARKAMAAQDKAAAARDKAAMARDRAATVRDNAAAARDKAMAAQDEALRKHEDAVAYAENIARTRQEEALKKHEEALKRHNEIVAQSRERAREAQAQAEVAYAAAEKARVSSDKAKKSSDDLVDRLARKGLVNKDGNFKVKLTKDKLVIDGKEQPESVAREFRSFVKSEGQTVTITVNNN